MSLPGSLQAVGNLSRNLARALAAYCVIKRFQGVWFLIAAGVLSVDLLLALNTGSLYHLITRVMLIGIVLTSSTRSLKPLVFTMLLGTTVFVSLQTVKFYFRTQVWYSTQGSTELSEVGKLEIWQDAIERKFADDELSGEELLDSASSRASAVSPFNTHVSWLPT